MKWILLVACLIFSAGCGTLYNSVDHRLFPAPVIETEATVNLWREGNTMTTELKSWVRANIAFLYYACAKSGEWEIDNDVYNVYPINGLVRHKRQTTCYSKLRIWMIAYNNFQKRTQKSAQMIWIVDMEKLIARHAAKGVRI